MPRPTTKPDLAHAANEQFDKVWKLIDSMSAEAQNAEFDFGNVNKPEAHWQRDKNLRDVLIHLYEWHQLLLNWVDVNQKGEEKHFLPEPYTWKTYGDMNIRFWEKHQKTSYEKAKKMLLDSHKQVLDLVEQFSNDELFAKKAFKWTGSTTLGSYCVSVTSSHYDWAIKKIKMHIKTYQS
jgi:hypothetical protein